MLPDFATMCQARLSEPRDPDVADGVRHHHHADAAFHRLRAFLDLYREGERLLGAAGAARGPARGGAHVAIELFLDGELVRDREVADIYLEALAEGAPRHATVELAGWETLHGRLVDRGVPHGYRDPALVGEVVARILSPRPLLACAPADERALARALPLLAGQVSAAAPSIMRQLRARLEA